MNIAMAEAQSIVATSNELQIAQEIRELLEKEIAPGTGITPERFWNELAQIVADLGPVNAQLLKRRDELQLKIDNWYRTVHAAGGNVREPTVRISFQKTIGYLVDEPDDFTISTRNVDPEIAEQAGPQLVVPVDNARYALNAANARWGSLFDALYGTDVIPETGGAERGSTYNAVRGQKVIQRATEHLDTHVPLQSASHADVIAYEVVPVAGGFNLSARLADHTAQSLRQPEQFAGFRGDAKTPSVILLKHNGLHIELAIDREHPVGSFHRAGLKDVILESALTTIQDCEDSVAAVDAADKAQVYRNWLGLMKGTLRAYFSRGGKKVERRLNPDRNYTGADGHELTLSGRSLMLVRNVGIHMYTGAVKTANGKQIPEGFLDIMMTALAAKHDLLGKGPLRNSRTGSIYVVKPKQHGPAEIAATIELFSRVEQALDLPDKTIKIGIMDEERRTTINLKACIYEARERVAFINTGFLDRTGDEIHTMMEAGPTIPKAENKTASWHQVSLAAHKSARVCGPCRMQWKKW
jgi:malate synthase